MYLIVHKQLNYQNIKSWMFRQVKYNRVYFSVLINFHYCAPKTVRYKTFSICIIFSQIFEDDCLQE